MITNTMYGMSNIKFDILFLRRKDLGQREMYGWGEWS
jgi:hypothetical protein